MSPGKCKLPEHDCASMTSIFTDTFTLSTFPAGHTSPHSEVPPEHHCIEVSVRPS